MFDLSRHRTMLDLLTDDKPTLPPLKPRMFPRHEYELKCVVCGLFGAAKHYGAVTCEGCRAFFKRRVLKNQPGRCYFGKECNVMQDESNEDRARFLRCKACRFAKCLAQGMEPTSTSDVDFDTSVVQQQQQHQHPPGFTVLKRGWTWRVDEEGELRCSHVTRDNAASRPPAPAPPVSVIKFNARPTTSAQSRDSRQSVIQFKSASPRKSVLPEYDFPSPFVVRPLTVEQIISDSISRCLRTENRDSAESISEDEGPDDGEEPRLSYVCHQTEYPSPFVVRTPRSPEKTSRCQTCTNCSCRT